MNNNNNPLQHLLLPVSLSQSVASFQPSTVHQQHNLSSAIDDDMSASFTNSSSGQEEPDLHHLDHRPIDNYRYTAHQDQTTLVLGVMNYLERLETEISEMKDFVNLGFKRIEAIGQTGGGIAATIEEYASPTSRSRAIS